MLEKSRLFFAFASLIAVLGLCATANAQVQEIQEEIQEIGVIERDTREGMLIGIGVGAGHMTCEGVGCEGFTGAGGLHLKIGTMVTPSLAIVGEIWGMSHMGERLTLTQGIATVGPQLWLARRFWIRAGAGVARTGFNYDAEVVEVSDTSENVLGIVGALGVELLSSEEFALDLQLRGGTGFFGGEENRVHNMALALGLNWY